MNLQFSLGMVWTAIVVTLAITQLIAAVYVAGYSFVKLLSLFVSHCKNQVCHHHVCYPLHEASKPSLRPRQTPPEGGATCFANAAAAYEALDAEKKERLRTLELGDPA